MRQVLTLLAAASCAMTLAASLPAHAGKAWDEIRAGVFAGRTIQPSQPGDRSEEGGNRLDCTQGPVRGMDHGA